MTSVERAPAGTVAAVLTRMRELRGELPRRDGVAVFNRVYLSVTEELERRLAGDYFAAPENAAELAVRFGGRYLAAVDEDTAGRRPPKCWRPLFRTRHHPRIHPVQFALAGINAHIGHDLALSVVDTCGALGVDPGALEGDYHRVGDVLCELEERVREDLMPGPDLLEAADPLTHLVGSWSLERARDGAWVAARVLWTLRGLPKVQGEFSGRLDESVGMVGRCLLTPFHAG